MPRIAIIDNYDSFTYNLVHLFRQITGTAVDVYRNDKIHPEALSPYTHIALSPGPGIPDEAGLLKEIIQYCSSSKYLLGICLGHQAIGEVFGASLKPLEKVYHGKQSTITILDHTYIFKNIPRRIKAGRYHSWVIDRNTLNENLMVTAECDDGTIMGIRHKDLHIYGLQFHPESILTDYGYQILENWINLEEL